MPNAPLAPQYPNGEGQPAIESAAPAQPDANRVKIIRPNEPFWKINLGEIWRYRYMLYYLVRRDIVLVYKQTVLGPTWVILQPLLMSFLFSILFGKIAGLQTDGVPGFLFYFASNVFWVFISNTYGWTSTVFNTGKQLMAKVYFPRLVIPLAALGGNLFKFGIQLVFLFGLMLYYWFTGAKIDFRFSILWLPVVVVQLSLIALGAGFVFSWATLKYRDLSVVSSLFIQGWMYISPVAYPLSEVPEQYARLFALNPVTGAIELARYALFATPFPSPFVLGAGAVVTVLLFFTGLFTYNIVQRRFIDVI